MNTIIKKFESLNIDELYDILRLRSEVFVVEQTCIYQDIDNFDKIAYHLFIQSNKKIIAYCRIFEQGTYFDEFAIGRVCTEINFRNKGLGKMIMNAAISFLKNELNATTIKISAQCYLLKFYNELGFEAAGDIYLEDNILHQAMYWRL